MVFQERTRISDNDGRQREIGHDINVEELDETCNCAGLFVLAQRF